MEKRKQMNRKWNLKRTQALQRNLGKIPNKRLPQVRSTRSRRSVVSRQGSKSRRKVSTDSKKKGQIKTIQKSLRALPVLQNKVTPTQGVENIFKKIQIKVKVCSEKSDELSGFVEEIYQTLKNTSKKLRYLNVLHM